MGVNFIPMTMKHYEEAYALWERTEGVALTVTDSREGTKRYLARNRGMSFVALEGGRVVGTILSGHDGRRGYVTHLAVDAGHRKRGIGRALVERAVEALRRENIIGCNLFIFNSNVEGRTFWESQGWTLPDTWSVMNRKLVEY